MDKKSNKIKYLLYARKSLESEDRQALSIDSQIDELKRVALRDGLHIVGVLSESRSAKTLGRPVFDELVARLAKGEANGILCWKLDRLARNFIDGGRIIEMLQQGAIRHIQTYERSYYPQDNVLLMSVEFGVANQYSRDLAVNVTRGMRRKAEMGWYPVRPPLGYLNSKTKGKGNNDIYNDPDRFTLVRKMWELMISGAYTTPKIWDIATNDWGLRGRTGAIVARSNVYLMFTNPFYYGMFEWPRGSGNWYQGKHEPMVTAEEFDRVQMLLGWRGKPRPKTHVFAFTGIMECGECGAAITAEERWKSQQNGNTHHYIYYHCTKRINPKCTERAITEEKLAEQVDEKLLELKIPDEFHGWAMKWLENENTKEVHVRDDVLAAQRRAYDEVLKRIDRYIEMRAREELTDEEYKQKRGDALKEKARLNVLLNDTDHRVSQWAEDMENGFKFVKRAQEKFATGTLEERKRIFLALGSNFWLEHKKLFMDMEETLLPIEELAEEVQTIHGGFVPRKNEMKQEDFEHAYAHSPKVSARKDLNLQPWD